MKKLFLLILLYPFICSSQTFYENMVFDDLNREFIYYLPNNYDFSEKIPVLFNFHGGGGYAQNFIESNDMRPIADTAQFIAVYPQGAVDYNGADPGTEPSTSWLHKAPTTHNDIYFIEAIIDTLKTLYNIDEERVYACGYSEGGIFTYELACRLNYKFAAIASVSGSMFTESYRQDYGFGPCSPLHPTAVMLIPGTSDANFHSNYNGFEPYYLSASDITNYWSTFNNTDVQPIIINVPNINQNDGSTVERNIWLNGDGCVEVLELKVINGGHDWPGSFGNMDISASEEIWRFVSKFNLNGLIDCDPTFIHTSSSKFQPQVLKVVNVLGKEVNHLINQPMFYIYKDGTVEKKLFFSK